MTDRLFQGSDLDNKPRFSNLWFSEIYIVPQMESELGTGTLGHLYRDRILDVRTGLDLTLLFFTVYDVSLLSVWSQNQVTSFSRALARTNELDASVATVVC